MISLARNVAPTAGALAQAAGVGIAGAAMPASGGVIHGCYATGGPLRSGRGHHSGVTGRYG